MSVEKNKKIEINREFCFDKVSACVVHVSSAVLENKIVIKLLVSEEKDKESYFTYPPKFFIYIFWVKRIERRQLCFA